MQQLILMMNYSIKTNDRHHVNQQRATSNQKPVKGVDNASRTTTQKKTILY